MAIKLKETDRQTIITVFEQIVDYKSRTLKARSWNTFVQDWIPPSIEQINNNLFELNHPTKNFFHWFIDQCVWCRVIQPGIDIRQGPDLLSTTQGRRARDICLAASRGQHYYDLWQSNNNFNNLFN